MGHFIVERFVPGATAADVHAWAEALNASIRALGLSAEVIYLGSEFVHRDETCLCFFDAASDELVRTINDHAGAPYERVLVGEAVHNTTERGVKKPRSNRVDPTRATRQSQRHGGGRA